jgi:hypothetical protein
MYSCQKAGVETSPINKPPIANAGTDQVITLPTDSALVDGNNSSDPDGKVISYQWRAISGPTSFKITNALSVRTTIKNLIAGSYQLELKVTDNLGLSATDTIMITVDATQTVNHPPTANAGNDQTIILPANTATINGSASTDPDHDITGFLWTKISGPSSFDIMNAAAVQAQITSLVEGTYRIELKVTDATGLSARDTVQINVTTNTSVIASCNMRPIINANLIQVGALSQERIALVSAAAGNKIVFAGGMTMGAYSSRVDIYDTITGTWSTAELSKPERQGMAVATVGSKILFAGGGDNDWGATTSRVDIYNASNNSWTTAELSQDREYLAATTIGSRVFFAGGRSWETAANGYSTWAVSNVVDIYDNATNSWTVATLSEARSDLSATTAGDKIFFAGGFRDQFQQIPTRTIDIFDDLSNSWSTSMLLEAKAGHGAIKIENNLFWSSGIFDNNGLGYWPSNHVEIKNLQNNTDTFTCITPKVYSTPVVKDDNIIFFPGTMGNGQLSGNVFDIYNFHTNQWSIAQLNREIYDATIISVNNTIYIAGGRDQPWGPYFKQVWKLEF